MGYDSVSGEVRSDTVARDDLVGNTPLSASDEAERQRLIDQHVAASNAFIAKFGTLADDLSAL